MTISFNQIPSSLRVPGNYLEVDPSLAERGAGSFPLRALIIGQKTSAGSLAAATIRRITSKEQASAYAGPGSIGSRMAAAWFAGNRSTELDLILLSDAGGAIPNVRSVSFGGVPAAGGLAVYVGGDRYQIDTSGALTATATALAAAIKISEGFNLGYCEALPGKGPMMHNHDTNETFICMTGRWRASWHTRKVGICE